MKKLLALLLSLFLGFLMVGCIIQGGNQNNPPEVVDGLKDARTAAISELESYVKLSDYSSENQGKINGFIQTAKTAINDAATEAEITAALVSAKAEIDKLQTKAEEELVAAITAAKSELEAYVSLEDYSAVNQEFITALVSAAKTYIDGCTQVSAVTAKVAETKSAIDELPTAAEEALVAAKNAAKSEVEGYILDRTIYSETGLAQIDRIISDAKSNIEEATETVVIEAIVSDAKVDLDEVLTIDEEKEAAVQDFKNMLVTETGEVVEKHLTVTGTTLVIDTVNSDSTNVRFGTQDGKLYTAFDTKLIADYRSNEWSSFSIRFRAWDTSGGYLLEIHHGYINVYSCAWGQPNVLIMSNAYGVEGNEEVHLQILCHEWQKTVLINGVCVFSYSEGDRVVGHTYIETWQTGIKLIEPKYVEYTDSASFKADYESLLWAECINKTEAAKLAEAKVLAKEEALAYLGDLSAYSEANKTVIQGILAEKEIALEAATSIDAVNALLAETKAALDAVLTIEEEANVALLEARANAKTEVENYLADLTVYSAANKTLIAEIVASGKTSIDGCATVEAVTAAVDIIKGQLDAVLTIEEEKALMAQNFKDLLVTETNNVVEENISVNGNAVVVDTVNEDGTMFRFGSQDRNTYTAFDTKIVVDYRSNEWSSFSIRFRAWDTAGGYFIEVHHGYINVYKCAWVDGVGPVKTLYMTNSYGIEDNQEVHLQILCHEWKKTVLINGVCVFTVDEGDRCVGYTYVDTWQTGLKFIEPKYVEYADSASFKAEYESLLWTECINKSEEEKLAVAKTTAKSEIASYISDLSVYTDENKAVVQGIVSEKQAAVEAATSVDAINALVAEAKAALDEVPTSAGSQEPVDNTNAVNFKNGLVNDTANLVEEHVTISGQSVVLDTVNRDDTLLHFGTQSRAPYSVLDTKIIVNYRNTEWSSFSIRFNAWDAVGGYRMEIKDGSIKVFKCYWSDGAKEDLLVENSYGIKNGEEVHLQILCHEWQKTVLINGECIFSICEGDNTTSYTYIATWQSGITFVNPKYVEYPDSASFKAEYSDELLWKESINKINLH